jgi:hypothetical protein
MHILHDITKQTKAKPDYYCYYFNQECGDFFDRIGKTMLKRMYVLRSSVLNID